MSLRTFILALLLAFAWLALAPSVEAFYYRGGAYRSPYTGGYGASRGGYNSYTGGYYHGTSTYNPYTGRDHTSGTYYNPYTNRYAHAGGSYNPYTGRSSYHYS